MPSTPLRQSILRNAKHIVVKIGTQLVTKTTPDGPGIDTRFISQIIGQIAKLRAQGREVTLVCSGAVGAGCVELGLHQRPTDAAEMQAIAAVGQRRLISHLHSAAKRRKLTAAQLLLTRDDFHDRGRFLNIRNCVARLHELSVIPVLNENDTVAIEEMCFGDNDMLAALMSSAARADALILLTSADGLLDADNNVIDLVESALDAKQHARDESTSWGTGGMRTKLDAARVVTEAGEACVIAPGAKKDVLLKLMAGEKIGTVFAPADRKLDSRQRWIALSARPAGSVSVDEGAAQALTQRGKSLLATGR